MTCHGLRPLARWRDYSVSGSQAWRRSAITRSGSSTLRCLRLSSSRSSSTQACFCSFSFCGQYLRVVRVVSAEQPAGGRAADPLVTLAESHRLVCRVCGRHWFNDGLHQPGICFPDPHCCGGHVRHRVTGDNACASAGCFPVLGFLHDGVVHCGDDPDDP